MAKKSLTTLAGRFYEDERPIGTVIELSTVINQAVNAARAYAAYGAIESKLPVDALLGTDHTDPLFPVLNALPVPVTDWVDALTDVTQQEWGVIKPLFILYVERENAIHLEASRQLGVDVYGRQSSEISQEITQMEEAIPRLAFYQPVISV